MSLPSLNFLHLMVAEIWQRQRSYKNFNIQVQCVKVKGSVKVHDGAQLDPQGMSLPSLNFLDLMVAEIWPG